MKRELGIARCGLACCVCTENIHCAGCNSGEYPDKDWCENRKCSLEKGISHCYVCDEDCPKGLFPRVMSQVAMLAWIFGECREGQIPRCSAALQA